MKRQITKRNVLQLCVLIFITCAPMWMHVSSQEEYVDVTSDDCSLGLTDDTPRYAVVSAFGRELQLHIESAEVENVYAIGGRLFTTGTLMGKPVVMFNSGGSLVNPAITMQDACYHFNISKGVLFSGIAGAMDESINIGDVTIPAQWREYWHALIARENQDGTYQIPGWFPGDPAQNFEFIHPMPVSFVRVQGTPDENLNAEWFPVSEEFLAIAEEAVADLVLLDCVPEDNPETEADDTESCLSTAPKVVVGGNGVSGDTYMDNTEVRQWVNDNWDAVILDMESASVAHWAANRGVPVLIVRSASDLAGGGEAENEIETFLSLAADNGAMVLQAILAALPE